MPPTNLKAIQQRNHAKALEELSKRLLAGELAKLPPPAPAQPIDPELEGKTLPEMFDRAITRHIQIHGNDLHSTAVPQAGFFERKELLANVRQTRKEIYRAIAGPTLKEPWEE